MRIFFSALISIVAVYAMAGNQAQAAVLDINFLQDTTGVKISYDGSFARGSLIQLSVTRIGAESRIDPDSPLIVSFGDEPFITFNEFVQGGIGHFESFGTGGEINTRSSSGDFFGFTRGSIYLPSDLPFGQQFAGSLSFNESTFESLGIEERAKTFSFGLTTINYKFSNVGEFNVASIPLPATTWLLLSGLIGIGILRLGRQHRQL